MLTLAAGTSPSAYWYLMRGTGVVALVLLTLTVALGVANVRRVRTKRIPRFVLDGVHRNVSLLAVTFLLVHIVTALLDVYVSLRLVDVVVPFGSTYRPLWIGLGTVSLDLLFAVLITSLLRRHFGYRAWRATHWAAYAAWPAALLHTLGAGTDVGTGWMRLSVTACVLVVLGAVVVRVGGRDPAARDQARRHRPRALRAQ